MFIDYIHLKKNKKNNLWKIKDNHKMNNFFKKKKIKIKKKKKKKKKKNKKKNKINNKI